VRASLCLEIVHADLQWGKQDGEDASWPVVMTVCFPIKKPASTVWQDLSGLEINVMDYIKIAVALLRVVSKMSIGRFIFLGVLPVLTGHQGMAPEGP